MRGRKPDPTKIIELKGGSKHTHRPPRSGEPKPPSGIPQCPKHLDKEARKEWKRMGKKLDAVGLLTELDKTIFAIYCEDFSIWANATRIIQEKGMIFSTPGKTRTLKDGTIEQTGGGFPMITPYYSIANKAKDRMMKALAEMGMTPSSRSRVKVAEPKKSEEEDKKRRFFQ